MSLFITNLRVNGLFLGYGLITNWFYFSKFVFSRFFTIRWQGVVVVTVNEYEQDVKVIIFGIE